METTHYNKEHVLKVELKTIEELTERVKSASALLSSEIEFFKLVSTEIDSAASIILPSVKEYLKVLIEVRMGFAREVQDILRSSRELTELVKSAPKIEDMIEAVIKLDKALNGELINKIKQTFNVESK